MGDHGAKAKERRDSLRILANFECLCSGFKQKGSGVLVDLSGSGALIEEASFAPVRGELVAIDLDLPTPGASPLIGWVARHTGTGFAIEFDDSSPDAKRLASDIAALVDVRLKPDPAEEG